MLILWSILEEPDRYISVRTANLFRISLGTRFEFLFPIYLEEINVHSLKLQDMRTDAHRKDYINNYYTLSATRYGRINPYCIIVPYRIFAILTNHWYSLEPVPAPGVITKRPVK